MENAIEIYRCLARDLRNKGLRVSGSHISRTHFSFEIWPEDDKSLFTSFNLETGIFEMDKLRFDNTDVLYRYIMFSDKPGYATIIQQGIVRRVIYLGADLSEDLL